MRELVFALAYKPGCNRVADALADHPDARSCLERLYSEYQDTGFLHKDTNMLRTNGDLVVGIQIARQRHHGAKNIQENLEDAEIPAELAEKILEIIEPENQAPQLYLVQTVG